MLGLYNLGISRTMETASASNFLSTSLTTTRISTSNLNDLPYLSNNLHTTITMPTSHISTPLAGVDAAIVIAALHNHDLMIKTLCPALVSYHFESGDKTTSATYSITDRKPIGQVRSLSPPHTRITNNNHRQPTNSRSPMSPAASTPSSTRSRRSAC
jgi:hypothetical protein